ncbi:hypothetical protein [Fluviicola taffensis]|uniref:Polysaccharide deacetylase n=1 Tax=Fluviicola taffensis (strain DSM 16823 / NCIMB 13979 / RW262) TaxID=755732 RepID=F2II25_FLUTR|nr:hypothetical protein [Fluviicola taffensis]AEA42725.1 hypothetical protein Fluta_0721 [Fluviicola taffensis DSM 16823]
MTNREKYYFDDFTTANYQNLIRIGKENYDFKLYHELENQDNFILLRHDIDFSPQRALRCAQIENAEGVRTTYFIHLHSEFYNVFEKEAFNSIRQIIELGHDVGVHFDTHFYDIQTEDEIRLHLNEEKLLLESLFKVKIHSFSFHNTNAFILNCRKPEYAGLINCYSDFFQQEMKYCSDSNGYWRYERMEDVIRSKFRKLHLLTHCEWWTEEVMSPWQKIQRAIDGRADACKQLYSDLLHRNNMINVDWD